MIHPYATQDYVASLSKEGQEPVCVPEWGNWMLRRRIGRWEHYDVAGVYPITIFGPEPDLEAGMARLQQQDFVSVVAVADPLQRPSLAALESAFDIVRPYKSHYMHDNRAGAPKVSKHHRHALRRASATVRKIELTAMLADWSQLYRELVIRKAVTGPAAFSDAAFRRFAGIPGLTSFGAFFGGKMVSCHLWLDDGRHAHSHLAASSAQGYACGAAYQLYDAAIEHFASVETIDFGGVAGMTDNPDDGLARFKRGFSNREETAYLCGKILRPGLYAELCAAHQSTDRGYFPAYRAEETSMRGGSR